MSGFFKENGANQNTLFDKLDTLIEVTQYPGTPEPAELESLKARLLNGERLRNNQIAAMGFHSPARAIHLLRYFEQMPIATALEHERTTAAAGAVFAPGVANGEEVTLQRVIKTVYFMHPSEIERYRKERPQQVDAWQNVQLLNRAKRHGAELHKALTTLHRLCPSDAVRAAVAHLAPLASAMASFDCAPIQNGKTDTGATLNDLRASLWRAAANVPAANDDAWECH